MTQLPPRNHFYKSEDKTEDETEDKSIVDVDVNVDVNVDGDKISSDEYYDEYHGHKVKHLQKIHDKIRKTRACCFLVGDSSLDNKYWLNGRKVKAINGYEEILTDNMVKDVAYWVNKSLIDEKKDADFFCVNASVEESTVEIRQDGNLLPQDQFVQNNIKSNDVLICSVGGNDIALKPTTYTMINLALLLLQPTSLIENNWAIGTGHLYDIWKTQTENYIKSLCLKNKPKIIVICSLYYIDEKSCSSWANNLLSKIGYDSDPEKIQLLISKIYDLATTKIEIEGTTIIPFPLFKILDGKNTKDYVQRVEPSILGGSKIGKALVKKILDVYN